MRKAACASAPGRFAFSIQTALLSVQFRSARQTENCDAGNSAGQPSAATALKEPVGACREISNKYIDDDIYNSDIGRLAGVLERSPSLNGIWIGPGRSLPVAF